MASATITGPSSSQSPYILPVASDVQIKSILTVGDAAPNGYKMSGIPDGLGAFDNGDGTFTLLMNHEIANTSGVARVHGGKGAFVSAWVIKKSDLSVVSGADLIQNVYNWDTVNQVSATTTSVIDFNRFCSADLPAVSAFYNPLTGKGTTARIFMNGEEGGATGFALATVATGASKGNAYVLGKFNLTTNGSGLTGVGGWENLLANPYAQDKTIVIGNNDGGTGLLAQSVAVYVGTKTNTGSDVDKAGLTNGAIKFVNVAGNTAEITNTTTRTTNISSTTSTRFTLSATASTTFSRPEDGAWNPSNYAEYYFVTTDRLDTVIDGITTAIPNSSTPVNQIGRSRLWRLTFDDITNPDAGGKIDMLLDGTEGQTMFDNLSIDKYGHITLLEDTGNSEHSGKVWQYDIATDKLTQLAQFDTARFGNVVNGVVTPATAPFTIDEETSGVIDVQDILGPGWSLLDAQAHYTKDVNGNPLPTDLVEGGQLLAMYNPTTAASAAKSPSKTGPSSSSSPYIVPVAPGVEVKSILTVGDAAPNGYKMSGIPDGLGAFDNGDGTFTLLMNHEIGSTSGAVRTHGGKGAFVSTWVIKKSDLSVVSGGDLIQNVYNWDTVNQVSATTTSTIDFSRFCSADLPAVSAFYNSATGKGTAARIFMNGEEGGATGFALATVATGANKGNAYVLGKFDLSTNGSGLTGVGGWENLLANPYAQDKTIVIGNNDGGTGIMAQSVAVYVGTKTNTGSDVDKAGLTNGTIKFVNVAGNTAEITNATTRATNIPLSTTFTLSATASTTFSRPEDGAWNPSNYSEYYFVTTDRLDTVADGITTATATSPASQIGRSRLWRLTFDDITNPDAGGKIDMLLDGTEGQNMFDNLSIDKYGHITLLEDTGNAEHSGKIWQYDIATDKLTQLAQLDATRFGNVVNGVVTPATAPFTIDEETSGVIDVQDILGAGWSLVDVQAHYTKDANGNTLPTDLVEGGQLLAIYNPTTANSFNTATNKVDFSGVAAGDATTNSEILWTRTIDTNTKQGIMAKLTVLLSTDATFSSIAKSYTVTSDPNRDYTAKIDATGLQANTRYYYRFITTGGDASSVGTFKTAADVTTKTAVRFGFSGDADGLFRPYVSTQNFKSLNLDYFLFEGDTIYETQSGNGTPAAPGANFSATAVGSPTGALLPVTDANASQALIDYQRKYLENLQPTTPGGFAGLQTLFASQGNYTLLDNHELGNRQLINGGAPSALASDTTLFNGTAINNQNGIPTTLGYGDANTTGTFINKTIPFKTLLQAYSTYQPIRETTIAAPNDARTDGTQQLYNAQQWGRNSVFVNLDTRSYRDVRLKKADGSDDTGTRADNPNRTMLGATQLAWLKKTLLDAQNNGTVWKFVATSDPIDQIGAIGDGADGGKSWAGGYRAERNDLLNFIADNNIKNVVFLATDDHQNRINELTYTDKNGVVKVLQNALSVVDGPIGATGPDNIADHSIANIQAQTKTLYDKQVAAGVNPIGLATSLTDPNSAGLVVKNIKREGDANPTANASSSVASAFDFYSPDTFNYTVFDVSADGKTLNVDLQGVNSYLKSTFPEPSASNPVRSILSFSLDATVDKKLVKVSDDVFDLSANSNTEAKLKVTLTKSSGQIYELGVVVVDDATGTIGGVLPTAADYAKLVLSKGKVILSGIDNLPNGYAPSTSDLTRLLQLSPDQSLRFYLLKNRTTGDDIKTNGVGSDLQFSAVQKVTDLGNNKFSIDFSNLSATIESSSDSIALGTGLQGSSQGEVIDLRTTTGPVKADFTVNREAAYNNFVGFYKVVDATGGIDINGDNVIDLKPGDAGYTVAALNGRVSGIDLAVANQGTASIGGKQFTGGAVYAPFLISNGTVAQALAGQASVFFAYLGANPDKVDHVRLLGENTFGFEDIYGGGDRDYNDVIVKAKLTV